MVGTLDLERALKEGVRAFEPGLLAQANGNILYVDEINLLEDHIVDVLLDSAAMGVNTVEREGISYSHPARFILVGTMNPEEGDLRPQLLDRFGLMVEVHGEQEAEARKEVVRRRLAFEENPAAFCARGRRSRRPSGVGSGRPRPCCPRCPCPSPCSIPWPGVHRSPGGRPPGGHHHAQDGTGSGGSGGPDGGRNGGAAAGGGTGPAPPPAPGPV